MLNEMIELIGKKYPLTEVNLGANAIQKISPITFKLRQFKVEGIGNLSIMEGKALFGLMKMDTLILTANQVDAPLFSYDRILAMGNDTLITEFYDTMLDNTTDVYKEHMDKISALKSLLSAVPAHDLGSHWYDNIKHSASVSHRGKKCADIYNKYVSEVTAAYLELLKAAPAVDPTEKNNSNATYVNGLFENGGPSTDAFVKKIGKDAARKLFETVIFGTAQETI